mmetsp:Transcript_37460/g.109752  ORF Transcript_37460/g.109752 Transcript_37460/m.109752 type:complete len:262 (-) Transcript_37460:392-1177(-)
MRRAAAAMRRAAAAMRRAAAATGHRHRRPHGRGRAARCDHGLAWRWQQQRLCHVRAGDRRRRYFRPLRRQRRRVGHVVVDRHDAAIGGRRVAPRGRARRQWQLGERGRRERAAGVDDTPLEELDRERTEDGVEIAHAVGLPLQPLQLRLEVRRAAARARGQDGGVRIGGVRVRHVHEPRGAAQQRLEARRRHKLVRPATLGVEDRNRVADQQPRDGLGTVARPPHAQQLPAIVRRCDEQVALLPLPAGRAARDGHGLHCND